MNTKLITITLTLVVGIILAGSILIPVLNDATTVRDTYENEGVYHMNALESTSTDTYVLSWDHSTPLKVTVNDDVVDLGVPQFYMYSLICADDWMVRYETNTDGTTVTVAYAGSENYAVISASTTAATDISITLHGGTATFVVGETTVTKTYTKCYCIDVDGDYVMKKATSTAHLNEDSEVYIVGVSSWYGAIARIKLSGTIDDGFTISVVNHDTWTVSDIVVNAPANSNHIDLYDFSSIQFTVDTGSGTQTLTYSQVIIPAEVTAERSVHFTDGENALIGAIPIMVIVALLVVAVGVVARRND